MKWLILILSTYFNLFCHESSAQGRVDKSVLDSLLKVAEHTQSDGLVIFKDGKLYNEYYFGKQPQKIEAMSSTKSIVNFAIGKLITDRLLKSLDQPVYEFYPEWNQGQKKEITIRHLMNHTSGLQNTPLTTVEIYPSPDFVKLALAAEISDKPGTKFSYNNKAVNLLAGIVSIASGKRMDEYLKEILFTPLGITDFSWELDSAGNPHGMAGLQIYPKDLAKLGQFFLQKGKWDNKQLIQEDWFSETSKLGRFDPACGLLWWIENVYTIIDDQQIDSLRKIGFDEPMLSKIKALRGDYPLNEYNKIRFLQIEQTTPDWKEKYVPLLLSNNINIGRRNYNHACYETRGYLGNNMIVYPEKQLVVVRMISEESFKKGEGNSNGQGFNNFYSFFELSKNLIK